MKLAELKNKQIAIWGFGVEGRATAQYLTKHKIGFKILCRECEVDNNYICITASIDKKLLNSFDVIIKSPGISPYTQLNKETKTPMTSPTAIWFANEKNTQVIAVTGTKGKSTTASLLAHILTSCGKTVNLVGNIGQALIASGSEYDFIVLEASSFQIYDGNIAADIAVITNLFAEHVDWHCGSENYFRDKLQILDTAQIKIINGKDVTLGKLVDAKGVIYFNHASGFQVVDEALIYQKNQILNLSQVKLMGAHNLQNIGAALSVCLQLNLDIDLCLDAVKLFQPLAHRLQYLGKIGRNYAINDSIATTPIATLAAMETVDLATTTLLVGGYDRGNDWLDFAVAINAAPPKLLLLSGQNAGVIFQHLKSINAVFTYILCDNLTEAIYQAQLKSCSGSTILLSPGAPSFDQFDSYIQRGEFFEQKLKAYAG
ncbi:UDP-N-acetylmuramoylalanine--D-glutamate ligase [hydrothermal vent metagenome]|uniref:UDP-N-acetylmuramoylalanine--D-glutamate ligase n=1 Tax=hydrothermal vent metagenome TaxID=652676 RepID=A0A3B0UPS4_9ZZZZ